MLVQTRSQKANILRKTIEGYLNSFDYITVEKIISIQGIFVSDRTINMQFSMMQNTINGSVPTLFTQSSQTKHLAFIFFAATLTLSLRMF